MAEITGLVEATSAKPTSRGTSRNGLKINGEWLNYFSKSDDTARFSGKTVSLSYRENGNFKDLDLKSIKVLAEAPAAARPTSTVGRASGTSDQLVGIESGMALNNAVQIGIAKYGKDVTTKQIAAIAEKVLILAWNLKGSYVELRSEYESLGGDEVEEPGQEAGGVAAESDTAVTQTAPASTPKPRARAAAKKTEAPAPVQETAEPEFSDDIPFS